MERAQTYSINFSIRNPGQIWFYNSMRLTLICKMVKKLLLVLLLLLVNDLNLCYID